MLRKVKNVFLILILGLMVLSACQKRQNISLESETINKIAELENKYNITINYCNFPINEDVKLEYKIASDADEIAEAVEAAEVIFSRLTDNWTEDLMNSYTTIGTELQNMHIVFCDELEGYSDNEGNEISLGGRYDCVGDTIYLMADIHNFDAEKSISDMIINRIYNLVVYEEECSDVIREANSESIVEENDSIHSLIKECNPSDFLYYNEVTDVKENEKKYIYGMTDNIQDVYFMNEQSVYSQSLDCRQLIAPLLYTDEDENLPKVYESKHILEKTDVILFWFDYLFFFDEMYWHRWFE